jgi:hypothetical protein
MLGQVMVEEDEVVVADVLDVPERAGDEVVHADDAVAASEQVLAEVRAEEAGTPGDDRRGHGSSVEGGLRGFTEPLHAAPPGGGRRRAAGGRPRPVRARAG